MANNLMTVPADLYVNGRLGCQTFAPPNGSITDLAIVAAAAVQASKLTQQDQTPYFNPPVAASSTTTPVTDRRFVRRIRGATGTLVEIAAVMVGAAITGAATITVDVWKNGATTLSSVITLTSVNGTLRNVVTSTSFTSTGLVVNDILELNVVATAGGGVLGQGLACLLTTQELPQ